MILFIFISTMDMSWKYPPFISNINIQKSGSPENAKHVLMRIPFGADNFVQNDMGPSELARYCYKS